MYEIIYKIKSCKHLALEEYYVIIIMQILSGLKPTHLLYKRWWIIETNLNILKQKISTALENKKIIVDNVRYYQEGAINFLEIVLDMDGGIDLDTIVDATNIINPIVDEMDFIDESFVMDVVSKERGDE